MSVDPHDALEKARTMIDNQEHSEGTLRVSGVATALARERGVNQEEKVRARFFERLDSRMDETGPGDVLVQTLRELKRKDFRMGIVTFVRKPRISRRLDVWNLKHFFGSVISPEDVPEFKPSPRPFLRAMDDLRVQPRECFVVGDEPVDMVGGRKAGAKTIGLPQGFFTREELERAGADYIIGSLQHLSTIIPK